MRELNAAADACPPPFSPLAPRPRLPSRTVPTGTLADRSEPAAFLAQQSFDVGMAEQSSQRPSPLDEGTSFSLPCLNPTEKEARVEILVNRVVSEEVRDLYGDIMIEMKSLGKLLGGPAGARLEPLLAGRCSAAPSGRRADAARIRARNIPAGRAPRPELRDHWRQAPALAAARGYAAESSKMVLGTGGARSRRRASAPRCTAAPRELRRALRRRLRPRRRWSCWLSASLMARRCCRLRSAGWRQIGVRSATRSCNNPRGGPLVVAHDRGAGARVGT